MNPVSRDGFQASFTLSNRPEEVADAQRRLLDAVTQARHDLTCSFAIRLAVEEALSNAFHHGNQDDPGKTVTLQFSVDADDVVIEITDQGEGFDPVAVPDPTEPENVEIPSGRGIVLMRAYMTEVTYLPPGNRVRMIYRRPSA